MTKSFFLILAILIISATTQKPNPDDPKPSSSGMECKQLRRQFYKCKYSTYDSCCLLKPKKIKPGKPDEKPRKKCKRLSTPRKCDKKLTVEQKIRVEKLLKKEKKPEPKPDEGNGR